MDVLIDKAFSESGLIATMFLLLFLFALRYFPKMIDKHFDAIKELQRSFSDDLDKIVKHNKETNDRILKEFISQLSEISKEHEKQNKYLDKVLEQQERTHEVVKDIKIHIVNNNRI